MSNTTDETQENQAASSLLKEYNLLKRKNARLQREYENLMHLYKQASALRDFNEKEKETQMQYNQMLRDNSPDDIFLLDMNMNVLLCTSSIKKRITRNIDDKPFLPIIKELFDDDFACKLETVLSEVYSLEQDRAIGTQTHVHSGETGEELELFYSFRISPAFNNNGELTGVVVLIHDNTEMHNANLRAEAAAIAKRNFLANMSHEMRTPLNAIIGLSELVLDTEEIDKELENKLEKIHISGITLLSLVNDILDLSKIESGKFEINPVDYCVSSLINDVMSLNTIRIEGKLIKFEIFVDEKLPEKLYGDDLRIKQIFNNLLSNAFKYTNSGSIEWRVSFKMDGDKIWLVSSVKDKGIGIKPEDIEKLFLEYNQVDVMTNRKTEGTGLGLAITKHLVEMMSGDITVESEYGKGTTFHVKLLQKIVSETPIGFEVAENLMRSRHVVTQRVNNARFVRANLSYAHVLVVDDLVINLDVAKGMLKPYGIQVDCAISGQQAIEMIRAEKPHYNAVFMDHMMPGMDGIEATRIIREEIGTEYARNIPIIALTANAIIGNEEIFLKKGFQAFISKPIDMKKLDSVLRRWIRNKDIEKELLDAYECELLLEDNDYNSLEKELSPDNSLLSGIVIDGLDINSCLSNFDNDENIFIQVLRSYATNTRQLISKLDEYLEAQNLKDYAIVVHGIKGSSYGVFAQAAGKAAEELEFAAKAGNLEAIEKGHSPFKEIIEPLLDSIDSALITIDALMKTPAAKPDPMLLEELRKACRDYDMNKVNEIIMQLESFRYDDGESTIEWLREQINNCSFEEIANDEWPS